MKISFRQIFYHIFVSLLSLLASFIIMDYYVDDIISRMIPYASVAVFLLIRFIGASVFYFLYVCIVSLMKHKRIRFFKPIMLYFSLLYLVLLGAMLFAREPEAGNVKDNYVPFHTIMLYLNNNVAPLYIITNLLGNIVLFIPVGAFLCYILRNKYVAAIFAILCISGIEIAQQHNTIGSFDVDDILLNFLGACIGIICCSAILKRKAKA
ncbi:VanZ family protein [Ectobacillus panaciterrae]|uniref:VanZ family protein n=1 Tax=Ectobacillus panaciterrae TaxID=363872 RepID=UPI000403EBAE|nr:VanZ family protein [Ectobacillus panaciterrae]